MNLLFWIGILYASVLATVIGYKWFSDAIIELGVNKTVVFQNMTPLVTVIIGIVFLDNRVSLDFIDAGLFILIGVFITNYITMKNKILRRK